MAAPTTPAELLAWLGQLQFLEPAQIEALQPVVTWPDMTSLGRELMRRDWLTPYQVNQILQGRGEKLVLGCYRLRERLAEGAMGEVFTAWNTRLQMTVAIKTIHREHVSKSRVKGRFLKEMQTTGQLDHPHIIRLLDANEEGERPYLVMEFVEGTNLSAIIKKTGPLSIADAVDYARQTALGLQHAFERNVVHRDIKPSNLLLTKTAEGLGFVKILDFGLARLENEEPVAGPRMTQLGKLLGTVDYIAPEQAMNARDADIRSDIFSLGCTLYYFLTGHAPYRGTDMVEKLIARQKGPPPSVRADRAEVPAELDAILSKMLASAPGERYQTPAEVASALQTFASPPPSAPEVPPPLARVIVAAPQPATSIPPTSPSPSSAWRFRWPILAGCSSITILVGMLAIYAVASFFPAPPPPPKGELKIVQAKWSNEPNPFNPGDRKFALIEIERIDFEGPVDLRFEDLPDGVICDAKTIGRAEKKTDLAITVSFGIPSFEADFKIVATAGDRKAIYFLPIKVVQLPMSKGELKIISAKPSSYPNPLKPGDRKVIRIEISRKGFDGPVDVYFEKLPKGVECDTKTIPMKLSKTDIAIIVAPGIPDLETNIKIIATSGNRIAEFLMPLKIMQPKGKK